MKDLKIYVCTDHDGFYPVGVASVVIAEDEPDARRLLNKELTDKGLRPWAEKDYTLQEVPFQPIAIILCDGDY